MKLFSLTACAISLLLLSGCASTYTAQQREQYISQAIVRANSHIAKNEHTEAYQLTSAVLRVAPENRNAAEIQTELQPMLAKAHSEATMMGVNLSARKRADRSLREKILWYLPDRYFDLLDMFSGEVRLGPGIFLNMHATRAFQAGGGVRAEYGAGWFERRCLGGSAEREASINLACYGVSKVSGERSGTSGPHSGRQSLKGMHRPSQPIYQSYRDYWGLGVSGTLLYVGAKAEFHPIEIADFILGFATIDIGNDDFANTAGLNLDRADRKVIHTLNKMKTKTALY